MPDSRTETRTSRVHSTLFALPGTPFQTAIGILRVAFGWIFLWAFLDKTFGLGYATERANAWMHGGSPTFGFLNFGTSGPLAGFYRSLAGNPVVDWLFMIGLLGIGLAFLLGTGMRIAAASGAVLMALMWSAVLPGEINPFLDDHIVYAIAMVALALGGAGRHLGFGRAWRRLPVVQKNPWLV